MLRAQRATPGRASDAAGECPARPSRHPQSHSQDPPRTGTFLFFVRCVILTTLMRRVRYHELPTEQRHPATSHLDSLSTPHLLSLMNREDARVLTAIRRQLPLIARAVTRIAERLRRGGRLYFVGAGTSGRLGIIEAAECPPTFHTPASRVQAIIAGGRPAVFRSREGAEDRRLGAQRLIRQRVRRGDVVVGIAASGVTPFVAGALAAARQRRADTILLTCNPRASVPATMRIRLAVGPEILTGSTRLKAGTATKLVLNMLTLGAMVRLGKVHGNLMVDVRPTSRKLRARAIRIIQMLARCNPGTAARTLARAHGDTKAAVVMARLGSSVREAQRRLALAHGSLRVALQRE